MFGLVVSQEVSILDYLLMHLEKDTVHEWESGTKGQIQQQDIKPEV